MSVDVIAMQIEARIRLVTNEAIEQVDIEVHTDQKSGIAYAYSATGLEAFAGFDVADLDGASPQRLAELVETALVGCSAELVH